MEGPIASPQAEWAGDRNNVHPGTPQGKSEKHLMTVLRPVLSSRVPSSFRISIGADPGEVARVNAAFADFLGAHAVPAAVQRSMSVALDELLTNTVSYGLPDDGGEVTLEVELHPDRLTVTVSDNGTPFDPFGQPAPDTTLPVEKRPIGGLGIHLVRQLVEDVSYQRRSDRNVVVMTKRLVGEGSD